MASFTDTMFRKLFSNISITYIPEFEFLREEERFSALEIPAKLLNGTPMVTWRTVTKLLPRTVSRLSTRFPLRHLS